MKYRYWTDEEEAYLRAHYGKDMYGSEIGRALGRTLRSIEKKAAKLGLTSPLRANTGHGHRARGADHWAHRPAGQPWETGGRMWYKRTADGPIVPYSHVLWEEAHGPIPQGAVITFRDRNPLNCVLPNLKLITRAELALRNHNREKARLTLLNTIERDKIRRKYGLPPLTRIPLKKY